MACATSSLNTYPNQLPEASEENMNIIHTVLDPILLFGILVFGYCAAVELFESGASKIAEAARLRVLQGQAPVYRQRTKGPSKSAR